MSRIIAKYNSDLLPRIEIPSRDEDLRSELENDIEGLALLSKRGARAILKIGNDTLNSLIENGEIRVIHINGRTKIPLICLKDFIYNKSKKITQEDLPPEIFSEESSLAEVNKIIKEVNEGR